jgi:hypothetical protein
MGPRAPDTSTMASIRYLSNYNGKSPNYLNCNDKSPKPENYNGFNPNNPISKCFTSITRCSYARVGFVFKGTIFLPNWL